MARELLENLRRQALQFGANRRGNVAIIFGLAAIPLIGAVGAAVDYSRASSTRAAMQAAVDSTALMLSREAVGSDTVQLKEKADKYFRSLFNRPEGRLVDINPSLTPTASGFSLKVTATGKVDTTFARVIGQNEIDIGASSQVKWGMKKLELALALDNTGSMSSSNKMTELKSAVTNLLNTLKAAEKKKDDIKVAIIPFDTSVKLGTQAKSEPWFDWNYLLSVLGSAVPYEQLTSLQQQLLRDFWDGCVVDRAQPFDVVDAMPKPLEPLTLFPPAQCGSLAQMLPLTSDWSALDNKVKEMRPNGNTNVTIGLVWALHALTKDEPLKAEPPNSDLEKAIILLTDGQNTQNRFTKTPSLIDARTKMACESVKAANIKLYTVRVIEGNASLLKGCATSPDMFYDVRDASELNGVFKAIAAKLANLYIAR